MRTALLITRFGLRINRARSPRCLRAVTLSNFVVVTDDRDAPQDPKPHFHNVLMCGAP